LPVAGAYSSSPQRNVSMKTSKETAPELDISPTGVNSSTVLAFLQDRREVSVDRCQHDGQPGTVVEGLHLPVLKAGSSLTPPSISRQMELTQTPMPW
jgi:hypothetical protein